MRSLVLLMLGCAACLEEHGKHPDGLGPQIHGSWTAGTDTLMFDQADRSMSWTDGDRTESGTWRITTPDRLELICPTCPFEDGVLPIRITTDHLLMDAVMEGWQAPEPNAVWSGQMTSREPVCPGGGRTFSRMITLSETEAVDRRTCCSGTSCTDTITESGPWTATADGFTFAAKELFLIENAISERRWARQVTPGR